MTDDNNIKLRYMQHLDTALKLADTKGFSQWGRLKHLCLLRCSGNSPKLCYVPLLPLLQMLAAVNYVVKLVCLVPDELRCRCECEHSFLLRSTKECQGTMLGFPAICFSLISLLHLVWGRVIYNGNDVFLEEKSAGSFLSRQLLYNSWDFELVVPDNLKRECIEEICSYEEAREVFEDDIQTATFWEGYVNSHESSAPVDVSGLVAGIVAIVITAIIATVLGIYCYKNRGKNSRGGSVPVQMGVDGQPIPESLPLANRAPGLPSYNEALTHSGQHDAPPPPYSGGSPAEPPQTQEEE